MPSEIGLSFRFVHAFNPIFHGHCYNPPSSSEIPNRAIDPPPPNASDDSNEWEVHQILNSWFNHLCRGQGSFTSLKWKGLTTPPMPQVWNLPNALLNAPDIVQAFIELITE